MMDSKGNVIISDSLPLNDRRTQPLNGRSVFYYQAQEDASLIVKVKAPKPDGHYEKITKKINNYYFVNNSSPSGMPGALVVSEDEARGYRKHN
jgi:hypothetical protein